MAHFQIVFRPTTGKCWANCSNSDNIPRWSTIWPREYRTRGYRCSRWRWVRNVSCPPMCMSQSSAWALPSWPDSGSDRVSYCSNPTAYAISLRSCFYTFQYNFLNNTQSCLVVGIIIWGSISAFCSLAQFKRIYLNHGFFHNMYEIVDAKIFSHWVHKQKRCIANRVLQYANEIFVRSCFFLVHLSFFIRYHGMAIGLCVSNRWVSLSVCCLSVDHARVTLRALWPKG